MGIAAVVVAGRLGPAGLQIVVAEVQIPWTALLVVIGLLVLSYPVLMLLRRLALRKDAAGGDRQVIDQLERLRRDGTISDEEYKRVRRAVLPGLEPEGRPPEPEPPAQAESPDDNAPEGA